MAKKAKPGLNALMVANTQQMRRLAGTAYQLGLPYQLDNRLNIQLEKEGPHLVMLDEMGNEPGGRMVTKCWLVLRVIGASMEGVPMWLSVRFRDYIRLQPAEPMGAELAMARMMVEPDEFSPPMVDLGDLPRTSIRPGQSMMLTRP